MKKRRSILWFRTDLRVHDHAPLHEAIRQSDEILPVYCIDERLFQPASLGFRKMGKFRSRFLLQTLQSLERNLRARGSGLILLRGKPEDVIPALAREKGVRRIFTKKEVGTEEKTVCEAVRKACLPLHCEVETLPNTTLYLASDLPFSITHIPEVFTDFRKKTEREASVRSPLPAPTTIPGNAPAAVDWSIWPDDFSDLKDDPRTAFPFEGGEDAALQRLHHYLFESHHIRRYKETRNGLIGTDYSSKFSPWLANGSLSPRTIYEAVRSYEDAHGANDSTYWLIFELLWRDFFRFMMKKHGRRFFLRDGLMAQGHYSHQHSAEKVQRWIEGRTGVPFIDAFMRELSATGFMSNRGRQVVASYLCHDLQCDWRYGAAWFEEMLIDYDVSSNWCNWAYVAGVGNDPRKDRYFNTERQADMYDKQGKFRALWLGGG